MVKKKRIVVTGMGVVSCFGTDVNQFYDALLAGKSGVRPITNFPCEDYPTRFAASVCDLNTENYLDKKQARRVDPFISYTMVAGKKALESSGVCLKDFKASRSPSLLSINSQTFISLTANPPISTVPF